MAKIKKIKEGTATVYPATIPQAVIDPTSGKSVRTELNEKEAVANKKQTVTNSATDYPSGAAVTASLALKTDIAELNKIYPLYNYNVRVGTDSGSIGNIEELAKLYNENLALLDSTVFLWSGVSGMKTRTSGSNVFASKLYNMANKVQQFGAELVTNGTFTGADGSTPAGWTAAANSLLTVSTNRLKVASVADLVSSGYQQIVTVPGKTYHFSYSFIKETGSSDGYIQIRDAAASGTVIYQSESFTSSQSKTISFVAVTAITFVRIYCGTPFTGSYTLWDNISVKQMDWIEGTNDAVQTTEANQPYVGGVIAPNEVRKLKTLNQTSTIISNSSIVFGSNDSWSLTASVLLNSVGTASDNERLLFGSFLSQIRFQAVLYFFASNSATPVTLLSESFIKSKIGKNIVFTVVGRNGILSVYVDGLLINTITADTASDFRNIYTENNQLPYLQIHNRALSASEVQAQHDYLRLQIPEIEGIAIGNQYWPTSNYEGVVAGDGSVIPEVQNSDNVEKITDVRDREFSEDTGFWNLVAGLTISDGICKFRATNNNLYKGSFLVVGRLYKLTYSIKRNASGTLYCDTVGSGISSTVGDGQTIYFLAKQNYFNIIGLWSPDIDIDDISIQEVGWSQSTALYDAIYAQTSGSTAQKELAALKAAAMWCYYNNDVNNGAIYGKLYNWYAVKLISLYPPAGYRVPSEADFTQLQTYLGGSAVAGGKIKKEGLTYWGASTNTGATNESGLSAVAGGIRMHNGSFVNIGIFCWFARANSLNSIVLKNNSADITISDNYVVTSAINGVSLRLLRNSPVGANERTITSTTIVSDIASTANSTQIPFGYSVASIRLRTTANLTNIKVELWNNFYSGTPTLVATLITGKTANNTTMVFPVSADCPSLLQDGTLRITATGANTFETIVEYNLQKNTF